MDDFGGEIGVGRADRGEEGGGGDGEGMALGGADEVVRWVGGGRGRRRIWYREGRRWDGGKGRRRGRQGGIRCGEGFGDELVALLVVCGDESLEFGEADVEGAELAPLELKEEKKSRVRPCVTSPDCADRCRKRETRDLTLTKRNIEKKKRGKMKMKMTEPRNDVQAESCKTPINHPPSRHTELA